MSEDQLLELLSAEALLIFDGIQWAVFTGPGLAALTPRDILWGICALRNSTACCRQLHRSIPLRSSVLLPSFRSGSSRPVSWGRGGQSPSWQIFSHLCSWHERVFSQSSPQERLPRSPQTRSLVSFPQKHVTSGSRTSHGGQGPLWQLLGHGCEQFPPLFLSHFWPQE